MKALYVVSLLLTSFLPASLNVQVARLPSYDGDIYQTAVSGQSSGGFMAVQFDVAYSSLPKGAGIIAAGP
ncbi:hypothetical protein GD429_38360 [Burkholderia sp. BE17]|nr:hypothetical protein [Burkholderia sp. BE17]